MAPGAESLRRGVALCLVAGRPTVCPGGWELKRRHGSGRSSSLLLGGRLAQGSVLQQQRSLCTRTATWAVDGDSWSTPPCMSEGQLAMIPTGMDEGSSKAAGLESSEGLFVGLSSGWCWLFAKT